MGFHLYPQDWGFGENAAAWGAEYIREHAVDATKLGKPALMGEFGWKDNSADQATRQAVYKEWTDTFLKNGGDVSLFWILSSYMDDGTLYPDYDRFTVYCPSVVCTLLYNHANQMASIPARVLFSYETGPQGWAPASWDAHGSVSQASDWATHLTHSLAITATGSGGWFGLDLPGEVDFRDARLLKLDVKTGATGALKNVAFKVGPNWTWCELPQWNALTMTDTVKTVSIDLRGDFKCGNQTGKLPLDQMRSMYLFYDAGEYRQDHVRVEGDARPVVPLYMPLIVKNGPISVKPTATPTGPTRTPTATATATSTPTATATGAPSALLYGYETGVEGWASANWEQAGTVSQSSDHATQGSHSLQVNALGGWIVVEPNPALDLSGKTMLKLDIYSATATQVKVSFTSGSGWSWQETGTFSLNAGQNTVSVDLANLSGAALANPNDVKRIGVYYSAGTYYQDNVRVE
jgi:hypothetical protein